MHFKLQDSILHGEIDELRILEDDFYKSFQNRDMFLNSNWMYFLLYGSFPKNLYLDEFEAYKNTIDVINDVVEKDIIYHTSLNVETKEKIFKLLSGIAFYQLELSKANLAKFVNLSYSQISNILRILEETNILFQIAPYDSIGRGVRKSSRYYFISPNLNVALNNEVGNYDLDDNNYIEKLSKSLVASNLFKMKIAHNDSLEIYFPKNKNQADFLIKSSEDNLIPIEVGFGRQPKRHVFNSIDDFDCDYGIVVCDAVSFTKKSDNVIYMPLTTFSLI